MLVRVFLQRESNMIRSALRKFFVGDDPAPEPVTEIRPDPRGAPGTRVHHEYFIDQDAEGTWFWLCRVYSQTSAATEQQGTSATEEGARSAALSWAAKTKAVLRGEA